MRYVLDTSAIVQRPEILAYAAAGKLLLPQAVADEIRRRESRGLRGDLRQLLDSAVGAGAFVVPARGGTAAELALSLAEEDGPENVRVATTDRHLARSLASKGITAISGRALLSELSAAAADGELAAVARRLVASQHWHLVTSVVLALFGTSIGVAIVLNHQLIFHRTPTWFVPILLVVAAAVFFGWRERHRLSFGLFELMIGGLVASQSIIALPVPYELSPAKSIQFVGGLYIMIRGFDSLDRGVEDTRLADRWRRLFHDVR